MSNVLTLIKQTIEIKDLRHRIQSFDNTELIMQYKTQIAEINTERRIEKESLLERIKVLSESNNIYRNEYYKALEVIKAYDDELTQLFWNILIHEEIKK